VAGPESPTGLPASTVTKGQIADEVLRTLLKGFEGLCGPSLQEQGGGLT